MIVIILNYHEITQGEPGNPWALSQRQFEEHLRLFAQDVISPQTFLEDCASTEHARDHRVVLTFDDGCELDYRYVFAKLTQGASIDFMSFVIVEDVGKPGRLTWAMIDEMSRHGVTIGSHGMSHRAMNALPPAEAKHELRASKQAIENRIGREVNLLAFPYGKYSLPVCRLALEAGYTHLFTIQLGFHNGFEPFLYSRLCVANTMTADYMASYLRNPTRHRTLGYRMAAALGLYRPLMRWRLR